MDHTGGSSQPVQHPSAGDASALRRAWRQGIVALGPEADLPGLRDRLDSGLTALEQRGALDEASLLSVAEEAAQLALEHGSADLARSLSKRLRRAIYEFLLALDAAPAVEAAAPVAPLEPHRPARWGQVLIGVEEVEAAQREDEGTAAHLDLDRVVGADDSITAEVVRAIARSEDGHRDDAWTQGEAGRIIDLADAAAEEVAGLRALLEEAMASGHDIDIPAITRGEPPPAPLAYTEAVAAAQAYAAAVADARAAAEAEAAAALAAEEERAEALLRELEDAEDAAARAVLLRLRVMEAVPPPGLLDPEAMRVPAMFRRDVPTPPAAPVPAAAEPRMEIASPAPYQVSPAPSYEVAPPTPPLPPAVEPPPPPPAPSLFPIAPREGFHLTDPSTVDEAINLAQPPPVVPPVAPAAVPAPAPVAPPPAQSRWSLRPAAPAAPPVAPAASGAPAEAEGSLSSATGGWSVRQSPRQQMLTERMAQKRREEAVQAAQEAAAIAAALAEPERKGRRWGKGPSAPERIPDVAAGRDLVEEHLRRKRGAEAAALLQRIAAELPGRETADLALDSGDRCLALGQNRSATNCYLAGWRADPSYEAPLWRLADVCLSDREVALATGYLERIAELMRSRGDEAGAIAVYRKIVTVAPDREDIRRLVRLAQATGRLEV